MASDDQGFCLAVGLHVLQALVLGRMWFEAGQSPDLQPNISCIRT